MPGYPRQIEKGTGPWCYCGSTLEPSSPCQVCQRLGSSDSLPLPSDVAVSKLPMWQRQPNQVVVFVLFCTKGSEVSVVGWAGRCNGFQPCNGQLPCYNRIFYQSTHISGWIAGLAQDMNDSQWGVHLRVYGKKTSRNNSCGRASLARWSEVKFRIFLIMMYKDQEPLIRRHGPGHLSPDRFDSLSRATYNFYPSTIQI